MSRDGNLVLGQGKVKAKRRHKQRSKHPLKTSMKIISCPYFELHIGHSMILDNWVS